MIQSDYVITHLRGIWQLIVGRKDWRADMDISVDGVFRSLWALALSTPIAIIAAIATQNLQALVPESTDAIKVTAPLPVSIFAMLVSLAVTWFGILAGLVAVTRGMNATHAAGPLIITYNWSQLLSFLAFMAPISVFAITQSAEAFVLSALPVAIFELVILWNIIRRILPIGVGGAIALMLGVLVGEQIIGSLVHDSLISLYGALS